MSSLTTINDLLEENGFDLERVGYARHPYRTRNVKHLYEGGYMDLSMSLQDKGRFDRFDYVLSFLGFPYVNCLFLRGYEVRGYLSNALDSLREYPFQEHITQQSVFYQLNPLPFLKQYEEKLIVYWGKGARAWLQNGTNIKPIVEIYGTPLDPKTYFEPIEILQNRRINVTKVHKYE